jgi:hypothetical protein
MSPFNRFPLELIPRRRGLDMRANMGQRLGFAEKQMRAVAGFETIPENTISTAVKRSAVAGEMHANGHVPGNGPLSAFEFSNRALLHRSPPRSRGPAKLEPPTSVEVSVIEFLGLRILIGKSNVDLTVFKDHGADGFLAMEQTKFGQK